MTLDSGIPKSSSWIEHPLNGCTHSPSTYSAKSASSTASSVFSLDAASSQSSVSSGSTGWYESRWLSDSSNSSCRANPAQYLESSQYQHSGEHASFALPQSAGLAPEYRLNPRRTRPPPESHNGCNAPRPPPSLVRQSDRKVNFVDSLVDTATQMVETIWPLSSFVQSRPPPLCVRQPSKMELRYFIQEVLKRSGASYSTLQVALYYLILIKQHVPRHDFTMEQPEDSPSAFSLQCGRRMFIAALILAWKYLQDRNFSASGWRKISGLSTWDLNVNEMAFLKAIDWKLHVPDPIFQKWTDIVLKYSPSANVNGSQRSPRPNLLWKDVVLRLTPDLDTGDFDSAYVSDDSGYDSPGSGSGSDMSPPPMPLRELMVARSEDNTPTPSPTAYSGPSFPETPTSAGYTPLTSNTQRPILPPPQPQMSMLPTPTLTPQTNSFGTPAASILGESSRRSSMSRSSMSRAMCQIQESCLARCTLDRTSDWKPRVTSGFPTPARRTSLTTSASSASSPDSTLDSSSQYSDASSRPSRSSSISSVASSSCAPAVPTSLAIQATRRCANMQLNSRKENVKSITIVEASPSALDESQKQPTATSACWSTNRNSKDNFMSTRPVETLPATSHQPLDSPTRYFDPIITASVSEDREAAAALRDLALSSCSIDQLQARFTGIPSQTKAPAPYHPFPQLQGPAQGFAPRAQAFYPSQPYPPHANPNDLDRAACLRLRRSATSDCRKRSRPGSMDAAASVEDVVSDMVRPKCLGDITDSFSRASTENATPTPKAAPKSAAAAGEDGENQLEREDEVREDDVVPSYAQKQPKCGARKRTCAAPAPAMAASKGKENGKPMGASVGRGKGAGTGLGVRRAVTMRT